MSTDYAAVCHMCHKAAHLGVRFTSGWAFGHGTEDTEEQRAVGEWLMLHMHEPVWPTVMPCDAVPEYYLYVSCLTTDKQ